MLYLETVKASSYLRTHVVHITNITPHHTTTLLHSIYIRTVSKLLAPVAYLPNWLKIIYGPFGLSEMHSTFDFCPDKLGRNQMYQKLKNS